MFFEKRRVAMLEAGASLLTGNALVAIHPSRNALAGTAPADPLARTTLAGWHWPWLESAWLTLPRQELSWLAQHLLALPCLALPRLALP